MFSEVRSPTGHFTLAPIPATVLRNPVTLRQRGIPGLNKFDNN